MTVRGGTWIYRFVLTCEDSHCRWERSFCDSYEVRKLRCFQDSLATESYGVFLGRLVRPRLRACITNHHQPSPIITRGDCLPRARGRACAGFLSRRQRPAERGDKGIWIGNTHSATRSPFSGGILLYHPWFYYFTSARHRLHHWSQQTCGQLSHCQKKRSPS